MKKISLALFGVLSALCLSAQEFNYDLSYAYLFDNMEYDASKALFQESSTMHGSIIRPYVGFTLNQNEKISHKVMAGFKGLYLMGQQDRSELKMEASAYYNLSAKTTFGKFDALFGVFPRTCRTGRYDLAFVDEENKFMQSFTQGMLLKYREPGFSAELGLDWMGLKTAESRERFLVFSSGDLRIATSGFHLGWSAEMYHFASSATIHGVVDNVKLEPYLNYKYNGRIFSASGTLAWLQTYQRDRIVPDSTVLPGGAVFDSDLRLCGFGFSNFFYFGNDLMPFYNSQNGGVKYGSSLYFGQKFLHTQIGGYSFYDRAMVYYTYSFARNVSIMASCAFHLGNPTGSFGVLRGSQQMVRMFVNIDGKFKRN